MQNLALKIIIHGKVQGVFYRKTAHKKAIELGIKGWVKNTTDGLVEMAAEGDKLSIEELLKWCEVGPPSARVSLVEVYDLPWQGYSDFRIVR